MKARLLACALGALALGAAASAQPGLVGSNAPVVEHSMPFGTGQLTYRASWSELVLRDTAGTPEATVSGISYQRTGATDAARPVTFVFNGGPGASSSPTHFGIVGPALMRRSGPGSSSMMPGASETSQISFVPNPETLLDVSDIVMFDPVGTGFSRELRKDGNLPYLSPQGDILAAETFIRDWLRKHGREQSPVFLIGESYGGFRGALLAGRLNDLDLRGIVLVSPAFKIADLGDLDYVTSFPSMAVAASAQGRSTVKGRPAAAVFAEAKAFALGEYSAALAKGFDLDKHEAERVAKRMEALLGIPQATLIEHRLRIDVTDFVGMVMPDKLVSMLDSRVSSLKPPPMEGRDNASSDPLLNMGASNVKVSPDIARYLNALTGRDNKQPYVTLSLDVNFDFNWNGRTNSFEDNRGWSSSAGIANYIKARPLGRVMVTGGYFDLATPLLRTIYEAQHIAMPTDRLEVVSLDAGHASYGTDEERRRLSVLLHRFFITQLSQGR